MLKPCGDTHKHLAPMGVILQPTPLADRWRGFFVPSLILPLTENMEPGSMLYLSLRRGLQQLWRVASGRKTEKTDLRGVGGNQVPTYKQTKRWQKLQIKCFKTQ